MNEIKSKYQKNLRHNYVNSIFIELTEGFKIVSIDFKNFERLYKINATG